MPAYFESGFSVREPMWHGMGEVLDEYPDNWEEARILAGLDWEPVEIPLGRPELVPVSKVTDAGGVRFEEQWTTVEGFKGIARSDTNALLAVPKDTWQVITNSQMGELVEAVMEAGGGNVKFETAGATEGGKRVWALAYLDEPIEIPGDDSATLPFFAFLNAHDGSASCKVLPTSVRVVCWNTWNAASAEGDRLGRQVIIRHTGDVASRIEDAKKVLANARDDAQAWAKMAEELAKTPIRDDVVLNFLDEFIPMPDGATDRVRNGREQRRAAFMKVYAESPTNDAIQGTAYGLVQAAGEYLDHLRVYRSKDTYLTRTMLHPEPMKAGVITLVRTLAAEAASN